MRVGELRERNLLEIQWAPDNDFSAKDYTETWSEREKKKFTADLDHNCFDVQFLMISMGVNATAPKASVEDAHDYQSLSWIVLRIPGRNSSRWRGKNQAVRDQRDSEEACFEEEVASDLADFWTYDPDPLVMMANETNKKPWMR